MPYLPGRLRQPSTPVCVSSLTSTTSGFTSSTSSSPVSTTQSLRITPTCGPARPTPFALCIVSIMSSIKIASFWSNLVTGRQTFVRMGSPTVTIFLSAIVFSAPFREGSNLIYFITLSRTSQVKNRRICARMENPRPCPRLDRAGAHHSSLYPREIRTITRRYDQNRARLRQAVCAVRRRRQQRMK